MVIHLGQKRFAMKRSKIYVCASVMSLALAAVSCTAPLTVDPQESEEKVEETARLNLRLIQSGETKSSISPDEGAITQLQVMAYRKSDGQLIAVSNGENAEDVRNTMEEIMKLEPDNVTVHTLAVKRASRLREELDQHDMTTAETLESMLNIAAEYAEKMGMEPYYMYRQKNMVGNFENVGYCHPGKEGVYNVQIMEEKQTILAAGAGASTKTVDPETDRIERVFNVKSIEDYIGRIDEMIERKRVGLPQGGNV